MSRRTCSTVTWIPSAIFSPRGGPRAAGARGGLWWQVDLGALFWIDEMFIYFKTRGEGMSSFLVRKAAPRKRLQHPVLRRAAHHGRRFGSDPSCCARTLAINAASAAARQISPHPLSFSATQDPLHLLARPSGPRLVFASNGIYAVFAGLSRAGGVALGLYRSWPTSLAMAAPRPSSACAGRRPRRIRRSCRLRSRSGNALQELYTFYDKKGRGSHRDAL